MPLPCTECARAPLYILMRSRPDMQSTIRAVEKQFGGLPEPGVEIPTLL